ncbi:histidine kinase [Cellulomonas sp. A375-1]|uniref:SpoIIE family protein phosphatase n=1 Tax=unclassified Cellulomonas TaxID=2620175 RepID=UPI0006526F80|nr:MULTISPECIES: SpoIIE family protein phosphatase [unclassified Cellulomonas]KMM47263.1 histidine kinase [Cellulomonas sp. A375-1]MCR6704744.1 SpoIIE family protein phosphatase [Cellulomonas sp.]
MSDREPMADLLEPGEPVDLDNCAREPIHVPGSVQPHGVLLAVTEPELVVEHVSANVADLLGRSVQDTLGADLDAVLGSEPAEQIRAHVRTFGNLRQRNPLVVVAATPDGPREVDAVLHRVVVGDRTLLVVELEASTGPRPFSFPNTYQAVRDALERLSASQSLAELYDVAAHEVRALTGFDRVMIYRFDAEYNGEVVAEAKRADLNSFLGLHYPASDIPPQARALYEQSWIRLIADVGYTPAPLVPGVDAATGEPLDLTHSVLRSVSPIHLEYLGNMGVAASMSISLLRDGRLWGLVACHHYSGPHHPPYGVRAAAEFLGSSLSLRLVARAEEDELQAALAAEATLVRLLIASRDAAHTLGDALVGRTASGVSLLELVPAQGVVVFGDDTRSVEGVVPDDPSPLREWIAAQPEDVTARTELSAQEPALADALPGVAGLLAVRLPEDRAIVWLRREAVHDVSWGGDPQNKAIARREGDEVRLSPRKSFEKWTQTIRGRSAPWTAQELRSVTDLRRRLLETLLLRTRWALGVAETVQRSLLPAELPHVEGWQLHARYVPAPGGQVGGDWYDALELPDGRIAVVIGDVAGHGLSAAAAMGQLRNSLRAFLLRGDGPADALRWTDVVARRTMATDMATVVVAAVDQATGEVEVSIAGHPRPLVLDAVGGAELLEVSVDRPVGVGSGEPPTHRFVIEPGGGVVLYSDGLVDSRSTNLRAGLARLVGAFTREDPTRPVDIDDVVRECSDPSSVDDTTLLLLCRDLY